MLLKLVEFVKSVINAPSKFDIINEAIEKDNELRKERDWRYHNCGKCAYSHARYNKTKIPDLVCRFSGLHIYHADYACPSYVPNSERIKNDR